MKWIGQQVYDFVATFRSGIIIDDINITTIQSSSESFADNDTSLMTSAAIDDRINAASASDLTISNFAGSTITTSSESFADNDTTLMTSAAINDRIESFGYTTNTGDITSVRLTADDSNTATDSSGDADFTVAGGTYIDTSVSGTTLSVAVREAAVTSLGGLTTIGTASATTNIAAGDLTMYNTVNDGNPTISLGSSATERLEIKAEYESGAQGLDIVRFTTFTAGSSSDDGRYAFEVDDTFLLNILDDGLRIKASGNLEIGSGNAILSDSSGTTTLSNIDALDATTESTIETAIDTLSNLTTVGTIGTGTWQGTAIASAYTKHVLHYSFKGFAAGLSSGNWQYAEDMADAQFPFQLNSDYGNTDIASGSLTDVSTWFRSSGIVMPRAATAISMFGWATCGGTTNNISIAICKITPTRNSTGAKTPVVLATITFAALNSNDKMEDFEQTSITTAAIAKGDILMPFIISPYDGSAKTTYFNVTLEVEG